VFSHNLSRYEFSVIRVRKLLTVFAVDLTDAHTLEASDRCSAKILSSIIGDPCSPSKYLVKLLAASRDLDDPLSYGEHFNAGNKGSLTGLRWEYLVSLRILRLPKTVHKATYQTFPHGVLDFGDLDLTETLDFLQVLGHCTVDGLQ
jgi:hypothetical protein